MKPDRRATSCTGSWRSWASSAKLWHPRWYRSRLAIESRRIGGMPRSWRDATDPGILRRCGFPMRVPRHKARCCGACPRSSQAGSDASAASLEQVPSAFRSASTDRSQAMDTTLSDLGRAAAFQTDRSRVHTPGLSARGRAHAGASHAAGASHHGSGEAGLAGAATSH